MTANALDQGMSPKGNERSVEPTTLDLRVTGHDLAGAFQFDDAELKVLYACFLDRLVPVYARPLGAAAAGEIFPDMDAIELLRDVGNLRIGADTSRPYGAPSMVELVIAGLCRPW